EEVRQRLANADRSRPTQLMLPNFPPRPWRIPTLDDDRAKGNAMPAPRDAMTQLIIVRQAIFQRRKPPAILNQLPTGGHYPTEGEIQGFEALGLQHLAPKIGIDG